MKLGVCLIMNNEELKRNLATVLQAFTNSENGNKITQFNMAGLAQMLLGVVDGKVRIQQQENPHQPTGMPPVPQDFPTTQVELPESKMPLEPKEEKLSAKPI